MSNYYWPEDEPTALHIDYITQVHYMVVNTQDGEDLCEIRKILQYYYDHLLRSLEVLSSHQALWNFQDPSRLLTRCLDWKLNEFRLPKELLGEVYGYEIDHLPQQELEVSLIGWNGSRDIHISGRRSMSQRAMDKKDKVAMSPEVPGNEDDGVLPEASGDEAPGQASEVNDVEKTGNSSGTFCGIPHGLWSVCPHMSSTERPTGEDDIPKDYKGEEEEVTGDPSEVELLPAAPEERPDALIERNMEDTHAGRKRAFTGDEGEQSSRKHAATPQVCVEPSAIGFDPKIASYELQYDGPSATISALDDWCSTQVAEIQGTHEPCDTGSGTSLINSQDDICNVPCVPDNMVYGSPMSMGVHIDITTKGKTMYNLMGMEKSISNAGLAHEVTSTNMWDRLTYRLQGLCILDSVWSDSDAEDGVMDGAEECGLAEEHATAIGNGLSSIEETYSTGASTQDRGTPEKGKRPLGPSPEPYTSMSYILDVVDATLRYPQSGPSLANEAFHPELECNLELASDVLAAGTTHEKPYNTNTRPGMTTEGTGTIDPGTGATNMGTYLG
ncbi:hypothetical protein OG21DRAFT_1526140 [Imleria badia]|nr:hypothetical protein OG21DRAFT_1526140 [Imleria badia]